MGVKGTEVMDAMLGLPIFRGVEPRALGAIATLGSVRDYRARTYVFHQGDPADSVFMLLEGRLEVSSTSISGRRLLHGTLEPIRLFGELGVLAGSPRTASVLCLEACSAWAISADDFRRLLAEQPPASAALLEALAGHVESSETFAEDLLWLDLKGRVAKRLLQLSVPDGRTGERAVPAMTHADLASLCGGSRENVSRVLAGFERRGFVRRTDRRYVVLDPAALERLAEA